MLSKTDIVNMALSQLGMESVSSIDENNPPVNAVRINYETALGEVLRQHPWGFALRRAKAAALDEAAAGFRHSYGYPADCALAVRVRGGSGRVPFEVGRSADGRKRVICTDAEPPLCIEYVSSLVEPNEFDAHFARAFAWRLSCVAAMGLVNDPNLYQAAYQSYQAALRTAKALDTAEAAYSRMGDGDFIKARNY
jgi:hypothetical protein